VADCQNDEVWTVGHSNHELGDFLSLLRGADIEVLADIRSGPSSRFSPHFNRILLENAVTRAGTKYAFMGDALGGRPDDPSCYDDDNYVLYDMIARTERFRHGIVSLQASIRKFRVAVMCSEEKPQDCHRRLLVGKVLCDEGVVLHHIRSDGRIDDEVSVALHADPQLSLLSESRRWRSARPVARRSRPKSSPGHSDAQRLRPGPIVFATGLPLSKRRSEHI
jgi:uncharacterized protein (DUF488 family)